MIRIFNFPHEVDILDDDGICQMCLEQLSCCYRFHGALLKALSPLERSSLEANGLEQLERRFTCGICDTQLATELEHAKHLKISHPQSRYFYCTPCQKPFKTSRGQLQHESIHHSPAECFSCGICQRSFITKTNYRNHMRHHKDFLCNFCHTGWLSEAVLLEHVRLLHADRLFACPYCDRKERMRKCLNRHIRSRHHKQSGHYFCGYCGITGTGTAYSDFESLTDHLREQHQGTDTYEELLSESLFAKELAPLECAQTGVVSREQEEFLQNVNLTRNTKARETAQCMAEPKIDQRMVLEDFLDEAFENDEIWKKYIENGEEYLIDDYDIYLVPQQESCRYRCPQCGDRGFEKQIQLTIHLAEEHDVCSLVCNDCGASFARLQSYRMHRVEHMKENVRFRENNIPEAEEALSLVHSNTVDYTLKEEEGGYRFTCSLCERSFQRKHNLEKHNCRFYKEHVGQGGMPAKQCQYCDFQSPSAKDLYNHQRRHQDASQENIYCTLCDRRFSSTSGLKYHLKRHTGIKAFTCLYCGKKFTANSNLNAHVRQAHSEHKMNPCNECNATFATKDHLTKHRRSRHLQERSYVCGECGKAYLQRSHLNGHIAATHRECRYLCHVCNSSYACRSSLKRHQLQNHGLQ
ncbi:zinc finger protein 260-like isoform X1 [Anopheles bellator]|uniref:zinc finger protein 260-like isoform X1 n=1 Tax=Anopheles bellator TaxID=139047 RepID=UPI00264852AE|nr:zinc finger protein 260-like isoform X1 [Anopheles bellator]